METKGKSTRKTRTRLPTIQDQQSCSFEGYDALSLMVETAKLRKLITKRGTLEILIPLCCTTKPVRYMKFRQTLKGFSSKTLASACPVPHYTTVPQFDENEDTTSDNNKPFPCHYCGFKTDKQQDYDRPTVLKHPHKAGYR